MPDTPTGDFEIRDIFKIPVQILPKGVAATLLFGPKHTFPDGNQHICQT